ncbi:hypothetical protein VTO58DRAFT_107418 [Aureobasidium pullulans]
MSLGVKISPASISTTAGSLTPISWSGFTQTTVVYTTLLSDLAPGLNNGEEDDENEVNNDNEGADEDEVEDEAIFPVSEDEHEGDLQTNCDR